MENFVWDKWVRFTHWSVAFLFIINYAITEAGSEIHQWIGYSIGILVISRLIWGLFVDSPARLSRFLPSVPKALQHIREVLDEKKDDHIGHNPAGAVMIWLLWSGIITLAATGYLIENLANTPDWLYGLHEVVANLTFFAALIHVSAVILMSKITGRSYLKSMKPLAKK